jgi:transposase
MSDSSFARSDSCSMYYVGLDAHLRRSSLCILDSCGRVVKRLDVKGDWSKLLEEIDRHVPRPFSICFEASCGYGHLFDRLARRAVHVSVAHPGQLRLIFRSKKKYDRIDCQRLAKLLYLGEVPAVHVPAVDVRAWRGLIEFRRRLVDKRVAAKNQVRALLRGLGVTPPAPRSLFTAKGTKWLKSLSPSGGAADPGAKPAGDPDAGPGATLGGPDALRRDVLVEELDSLGKKIARVEKELAGIADAHAGVRLLMTIPGVGVRTAEAFVAYVDRVERFSQVSQVGCYFGLVPCQDSSADRTRLGHVTKDGPATVRKLLTEAAWQGIRRDRSMRAWFERVTRDDPDRKKVAVVAAANRLCRVMAAMLRSGEAWRQDGRRDGRDSGVKNKTAGRAAPGGGAASPPRKTAVP